MSLSPVHHVSLSVEDLDRSIAFYRDVLGLRLTMTTTVADEEHEIYLRLEPGTTAKVAILQADDRTLGEVELIQWERPTPIARTAPKRPGDPGVFLVAFEVVDEGLEEACDRLRAMGVEFWTKPVWPWVEGYGEIGAVVCEDPDGLMIELLDLPTLEEAKANRRAYLQAQQSPEG